MKKLFLVVGCLLVLSASPVLAEDAPSVVTVRVDEYGVRLSISVSTGSAPAQTQEFVAAKKQTYSQMVAQQYQKLVSTYTEQGYVLRGIIPGEQYNGSSSSTLVFVKAAPGSH